MKYWINAHVGFSKSWMIDADRIRAAYFPSKAVDGQLRFTEAVVVHIEGWDENAEISRHDWDEYQACVLSAQTPLIEGFDATLHGEKVEGFQNLFWFPKTDVLRMTRAEDSAIYECHLTSGMVVKVEKDQIHNAFSQTTIDA